MTRAGLKRLECPNGCPALAGRPFSAYMTLAQIEHGMRPVCPGCDSPLIPEAPELWHLVPRHELEASAAFKRVRAAGSADAVEEAHRVIRHDRQRRGLKQYS